MKYELTGEKRSIGSTTVYRIKATRDILNPHKNINKGELGGFVESEFNLDKEDESWIDEESVVYGEARVSGSAYIGDAAKAYGQALIDCTAVVKGTTRVLDIAHISDEVYIDTCGYIYGNIKISNRSYILGIIEAFDKDHVLTWSITNIITNKIIDITLYRTMDSHFATITYDRENLNSDFLALSELEKELRDISDIELTSADKAKIIDIHNKIGEYR